jgi:hypothetical protein
VWIGVTTGSEKEPVQNIHYAFRHKLSLEDRPSAAPVRVTADARYILWVNGAYVGRGPARCYPWRQAYDEYDLAPFLRKGTNWIAAQVHEFGLSNGQHIYRGKHGLIMEGQVKMASGATQPLRTSERWEARRADWQMAFPSFFRLGSDRISGRLRRAPGTHRPARRRGGIAPERASPTDNGHEEKPQRAPPQPLISMMGNLFSGNRAKYTVMEYWEINPSGGSDSKRSPFRVLDRCVGSIF